MLLIAHETDMHFDEQCCGLVLLDTLKGQDAHDCHCPRQEEVNARVGQVGRSMSAVLMLLLMCLLLAETSKPHCPHHHHHLRLRHHLHHCPPSELLQ